MGSCLLNITEDSFSKYKNIFRPNFVHGLLDADMAFCKNMRENGDFFFVSNRVHWGHLVATEEFRYKKMFFIFAMLILIHIPSKKNFLIPPK